MNETYIKKIRGFQIKRGFDHSNGEMQVCVSHENTELIEALHEKILEWIH